MVKKQYIFAGAGILVIAVAAVIIAMYFLVWRGDSVDAAAILNAACTNPSIQSVTRTATTKETEGNTTVNSVTVMKINAQGRLYALVKTDQGGYDETIITADAGFNRASDAETWTRYPGEGSDFGLYNDVEDGVDRYCDQKNLVSIKFEGYRTLDGFTMMYLTAKRDMKAAAASYWSEADQDTADYRQFVDGHETFEFWINEALGRMIQVKDSASFPAKEELAAFSFISTVKYTDFNAAMVIEAPTNYVDAPPETE